jgi:sugar/nucleoside kinase (ribokinase family)
LLVTCAGILVVDIIAADLPKIANPGELVFAPAGIEIHLGGHSGNVSIDLRKLGLKEGNVSSIGAIGNDIFGNFIEETLNKYGVVAHLQKVSNVGTSKDLILVVRGEDRRYHVDNGANQFLSPNYVLSVVKMEKPIVFYAGGVGFTTALDEQLPEILREIKDFGALTFVDPVTPYMHGWDFLIPAMKWTDIFHCNMDEARQITGENNPHKACETFIKMGANMAIISLGDKGLIARTRRNVIEMPAFKVPVIDPTGAGDALCAGIISGFLQRSKYKSCDITSLSTDDIIEMLLIGEAAGAACVTMVGTTTAVTKNNVEKILEEQGEELKRNIKVSDVAT